MPPLQERRSPVHAPPIERYDRSTIIFLTVCTKDRVPMLASGLAHAALVAAWKRARQWQVGRYVILPDHVHLFCGPGAIAPPLLTAWVAYWKGLVSRDLGFRKPNPLWQQGFWDTQLRFRESYDARWEYVRNNPVRHGLVGEADRWPFQGEIEILDWHD